MFKLLFNIFFNKKQFMLGETTAPRQPKPIPEKWEQKLMKVYLTVDDILTSSGKYPNRAKHPECTDQIKTNAAKLVDLVNNLFTDLKYTGTLTVNSGFRTSEVNKSIPNAAKKSLHMEGRAVDLGDTDGKLDELLFEDKNDTLLKKHGLWLEHPDSTRFWSHLDNKDRGTRKKNVFKP